jgi:hypothetical protein
LGGRAEAELIREGRKEHFAAAAKVTQRCFRAIRRGENSTRPTNRVDRRNIEMEKVAPIF